jgi:hypothetical protein
LWILGLVYHTERNASGIVIALTMTTPACPLGEMMSGQTSVAKYMTRRRGPPSQGWKTFLHNHADGIAALDLFVVPTVTFRLLYGLLIMGHGRRQILWLGVTAHPDDRVDRQPTDGGLWLGAGSALSDPR